jgi:uncharacterized protein (DUF2141 family)
MKRLFLPTTTALLALLVSTACAQTGTITVKVTKVNVKKGGNVKIGIYVAKGFPVVGKEAHGRDVKVTEETATYVFKDIPIGKYAIAAFQDENADGELNTNLFGVPKEPYGFSMNKFGKFGPPKFKNVSFDVKEAEVSSLTIDLK